ncbi:hypothetical protein JOD54_003634 [Actinokineospora baliensis]|uniref:hypothetical protein n=1 Tax=Actinokineospora baliensis TaxID=547056 RepID=UPI001956F1FC|nr:hypothetical protein [Actinokineospora baliensis]MBM7773430.1 hypothetical protein [Actinokineospora baliensis]
MIDHVPDPARSRAVLIGVGDYKNLPALPTATAALGGLHSVLTSPDGLALSHCAVLANPTSAAEIVRVLDQAAAEAEDLLLVHCAGRVLTEEGGTPHLATVGTDGRYLATTALPLAEIRRILRRCQASRRVLLLDCVPGHVIGDSLDESGVFVLSAPEHTQDLLAALRDGIAGEGPLLTLTALAAVVSSGRVHDGGLGAAVIAANPVDRVRELRGRITEAAQLLAMLVTEHADTANVVADARHKILSADRLVIGDVVADAAGAVRDLESAAAAGHWSRVSGAIDDVEAIIHAGSKSLSVVHAQAKGLLARREELRGRLAVYLAMAVRVGMAEDPELAAAHRAAHRLLWTAPCDLPEATVAVTTYQNAVIRRRS